MSEVFQYLEGRNVAKWNELPIDREKYIDYGDTIKDDCIYSLVDLTFGEVNVILKALEQYGSSSIFPNLRDDYTSALKKVRMEAEYIAYEVAMEIGCRPY